MMYALSEVVIILKNYSCTIFLLKLNTLATIGTLTKLPVMQSLTDPMWIPSGRDWQRLKPHQWDCMDLLDWPPHTECSQYCSLLDRLSQLFHN